MNANEQLELPANEEITQHTLDLLERKHDYLLGKVSEHRAEMNGFRRQLQLTARLIAHVRKLLAKKV